MAAGLSAEALTHALTLQQAQLSGERAAVLLRELLARLATSSRTMAVTLKGVEGPEGEGERPRWSSTAAADEVEMAWGLDATGPASG